MNLINEIKKLESMINSKLKNNNVEVMIFESKYKYDGKIIIFKDDEVDRVFTINRVSYKQISISENNKILEAGMFIENLGAWLFNIYNPVEYVYVFYGGKLNRKKLTVEQIGEKLNKSMLDWSNKNKQDLSITRKVLNNQPKVEGYIGPMFEKIDYGKVYLRYETQEIYDMLSA